jgi:hypothetical protein
MCYIITVRNIQIHYLLHLPITPVSIVLHAHKVYVHPVSNISDFLYHYPPYLITHHLNPTHTQPTPRLTCPVLAGSSLSMPVDFLVYQFASLLLPQSLSSSVALMLRSVPACTPRRSPASIVPPYASAPATVGRQAEVANSLGYVSGRFSVLLDGFHTVVLIHSIIMFNCPSSTTNLTNGKVLKVK